MVSSPMYSLKLGHKILPGRVTVGVYDGKEASFTAATQGERVCSKNISLYSLCVTYSKKDHLLTTYRLISELSFQTFRIHFKLIALLSKVIFNPLNYKLPSIIYSLIKNPSCLALLLLVRYSRILFCISLL
jgi:hypothetical protein